MYEYEMINVTSEVATILAKATIIAKDITGKYEINCAAFFLSMLSFDENYVEFYEIEEEIESYKCLPDFCEIILDLKKDKKFFKEVYGWVPSKKKNAKERNLTYSEIERENLLAITQSIEFKYADDLEIVLASVSESSIASGKNTIETIDILYEMLCDTNNSMLAILQHYDMFDITKFGNYLVNLGVCIPDLVSEVHEQIPEDLTVFCTILNDKFNSKEKSDILGRDKEISELWNIMSKRTKKNAILIGNPGVGKTAIIEAITQSIVNNTCPEKFKGYSVIEVDITSMIAGTKYRGEFEARVQKLIDWLKKKEKIIVFIDEIHHIMGAGSAEGSGVSLSGALKPLLARDKSIFIGATTIREYDKYFKRDGALTRRFEIVTVEEPKISQVSKMISSKVKNLSKYHGVKINSKVLDYAIISATAFEARNENSNPDISIDLVDRAMAMASVGNEKTLTIDMINKVHEENFEKFKKISKKEKLKTAYHEAGHFVMSYFSKLRDAEQLVLISIIPSNDFVGVTVSEKNNDIGNISADDEYFDDKIAMLLAGRAAQSFICNNFDAGASNDLERATDLVVKRLTKYGMDSEFRNIALNSTSYDNTNLLINEDVKRAIYAKATQQINDLYEKTSLKIESKLPAIKAISAVLLRKGIVLADEAIAIINKFEEVPENNKKSEVVSV